MNKDILEGMWNKQHVERVEVVLKESVDVSGKVALVVTQPLYQYYDHCRYKCGI